MTPTPEQEAIIAATRETRESLMVNAYAGCAKTTTLELAARQIREPALALAFNKSIAEEAKKRFPPSFVVQTLNGFGFSAWRRSQPNVTLTIDEKKIGKLISQIAKSWKLELAGDQWQSAKALVGAAMMAGIVPKNEGDFLMPDEPENWLDLAYQKWISHDDFKVIYDLARETLEQSNMLTLRGILSFDDQIYAPVCLGGKFPQFPCVVVDESQDLSSMNHRMIELSLRPGGRMIAVGDRKQAIYQFRGADGQSMENMRRLKPKWRDLPLMTTFRCPEAVVERQQRHAPGFRSAEGALRGEVTEWKEWSFSGLPEAILCRNNAPLLQMAFALLREGIGINLRGKDIGKSLITLSRKICPKDETPAENCLGLIRDWQQKEVAIAEAEQKEEKCASIRDRGDCLIVTIVSSECKDAGGLRAVLEKIFSSDSGQILLSTIHRAKGLEWDSVMLLNPWQVPGPRARALQRELGGAVPEEYEQEWNLRYVAETRTRNKLILADMSLLDGKEEQQ